MLKNQWKGSGEVISSLVPCLPSCLFSTLSEAIIASSPWSYSSIQEVRCSELGGGLLILTMQAPVTHTAGRGTPLNTYGNKAQQKGDTFLSFVSISTCQWSTWMWMTFMSLQDNRCFMGFYYLMQEQLLKSSQRIPHSSVMWPKWKQTSILTSVFLCRTH